MQAALVEANASPSNESIGSSSAGANAGVFGRFLNSLRPPLNRTYTAQAGSIRKSVRPGSTKGSKRRNSSPARPPSSSSNGSSSALNSPHITPPVASSSTSQNPLSPAIVHENSTSFPTTGDVAARGLPMSSSNAGSTTASSSMTLPVRPQPERRQSSSRRIAAAIARPLFRRTSSQTGGASQNNSSAAGPSTSSTAAGKQRAPSSLGSGPPSPGPSTVGPPGGRRPFTSSSSRSNYSFAAQSTPSPGAETLHQAAFPSPFFAQITPTTNFPNPFSPPIDCIPALNALLAQPISSTLAHLIPLNLITQASGFDKQYSGMGSLAAASSVSIATSSLSEAPSSTSTHNTAPSSQRTQGSSQYPSSASYASPGTIGNGAFVSSEQLAASSLSLPTTSIGTIWRMTRALEWVGEHGSALNALVASRTNPLTPRPSSNRLSMDESRRDNDTSSDNTSIFDFSALLQSVLDAVASTAAQSNVDLAYFHGSTPPDAKPSGQIYNYVVSDIQEAFVQGDERGLGIGLLAVLKQVLAESRPGASIEIGLSFALTTPPKAQGSQHPLSQMDNSEDDDEDEDEDEPPLGTYLLTVEIVHTFGNSRQQQGQEEEEVARPRLDSTVSAALLQYLRLSLITLPPKADGQVYKLSCTLPQARHPKQLSNVQDPYSRRRKSADAKEPTLPDLMRFVETSLRGKKAAFHASESSDFAQHVSHHLVLWGIEVNHFALPSDEDSEQQGTSVEGHTRMRGPGLRTDEHGHLGRWDSGFGGSDSTSPPNLAGLASPAVNVSADPMASLTAGNSPVGARAEPYHAGSSAISPPLDPNLNFIIIDNDISVLKKQLTAVRNNAPTMQLHNALLAKRPQLHTRRTRSSQAVQRPTTNPVSIIHFTDLANYRQIKEVVHSILKNASPMFPLPEVLVVPKPVGPRRLLATLFNAVKRPSLDPYYLPIATSPSSPGGHYFFAGAKPSPAPSASNVNDFDAAAGQALASRVHLAEPTLPAGFTAAVSEPRTPPGIVTLPQTSHPPSPVSPDALEYFSRSAAEFGSNASQGIVIQSPDGRPTGLFFQPRAASLYERAESLRMARGSVSDGEKASASSSSREAPATSPNAGGGTIVTAGGTELPSIVIPESLDMAGKSFTVSPATISGQENASFGQRLEGLMTNSNAEGSNKSAPSPSSSTFPSEDTTGSTSALGEQAAVDAKEGDSSKVAESPSTKLPSAPSSPRSPISPGIIRPVMQRQGTTAPSPARNEAPPSTSANASSPVSAKISAPPLTRAKTDRKSSGRGEKSKKSSRRPTGTLVPPINVLIVEDNPINQIILSTFLKRKGVKYSVANNGQEAVDKWKTGDFHLVLMDIQLPVKDGIEATQEIRAMERASAGQGYIHTPMPGSESVTPFTSPAASAATSPFELPVIIVALTASSLQSDRVNALAAGCNDFLTKPVSLQWLNQKIVEWGSMAYLSGFSNKRRGTLMSPMGSMMKVPTLSQQMPEPPKQAVQKELDKVKEETVEIKEEKREIIEEKAEQAAEQQTDADTFARESQAIEQGELPTDVTENV